MIGEQRKLFLQRWRAIQNTKLTHPYVEWIAGVSRSDECKQLDGLRFRADDLRTQVLIDEHINRKDKTCGCRLSPIK